MHNLRADLLICLQSGWLPGSVAAPAAIVDDILKRVTRLRQEADA